MNQRETIAEIRSTISIVDVLRRMGVDPGHSGRIATTSIGLPSDNPSCALTVSPGTPERSWQTSDGRVGGDVVDLVRTVTGASLGEALALLALGGPISTPAVTAERGRERRRDAGGDGAMSVLGRTPPARVQAVNDAAWEFYTDGTAAALARRRLVDWGILSVGLELIERRTGRPAAGHTPLSPTGLLDHLEREGFRRDEIVDAGWAGQRAGSGELVDRYRNRVLLPYLRAEQLSDAAVVGVSGVSVSWATGAGHRRIVDHERTTGFRASRSLYQPWWEPRTSDVIVVTSTAVDALAIAAAAAAGMDDRVTAVHVPSRARGPALASFVAGSGSRIVVAGTDGSSATTETDVVALPLGLGPLDWLRSVGPAGLSAFTATGAGACPGPEEAGT